jgi:predicted transcriptional regulator
LHIIAAPITDGSSVAYGAVIRKLIMIPDGDERLTIAHDISVHEERQDATKKLDAEFFEE